MKPVAVPFASARILARSPSRARTGLHALRRRGEHRSGVRLIDDDAVAALVHLQRVFAVGRHAREVVRDLHAVRAFDERDGPARGIAGRGQQRRVGTLFVILKNDAAAAQQQSACSHREQGGQRPPVESVSHAILLAAAQAQCMRAAAPIEGDMIPRAARRLAHVGATCQVFCTTMLGNFEVMSRWRSAIEIATLRAIAR